MSEAGAPQHRCPPGKTVHPPATAPRGGRAGRAGPGLHPAASAQVARACLPMAPGGMRRRGQSIKGRQNLQRSSARGLIPQREHGAGLPLPLALAPPPGSAGGATGPCGDGAPIVRSLSESKHRHDGCACLNGQPARQHRWPRVLPGSVSIRVHPAGCSWASPFAAGQWSLPRGNSRRC